MKSLALFGGKSHKFIHYLKDNAVLQSSRTLLLVFRGILKILYIIEIAGLFFSESKK